MDRRAIAISGIVQGVGFRPFVHDLATRLGLHGFVRNQSGGVLIEVEGETRFLDRFVAELRVKPPPLAQIDELRWTRQESVGMGEGSFRIESSRIDHAAPVFVSPDAAPCEACLQELFDPNDRRYRYPFLNCTNCGPRLTIIREAPYDRERTTMGSFAMCPACRAEYDNPRDRRFHAQPTACPACGPRLSLVDANGQSIGSEDPLTEAVASLRGGKIIALKGVGGFHLACLAAEERAVRELRRRKHRDDKSFAIMVRDRDAAQTLCEISPDEADLLNSPRRPIVLLRRKLGAAVAVAIAPGNPMLGVMLPSTPLHHLLLHDLGLPLVMTSGNRSDEPIAFDDEDALSRLQGIADLFLTHNRPIALRCDDSVTRSVGGFELPIRRSRGDAPVPLSLPFACTRPILAMGGQLKSTFAIGRDRHAFLSHHIGDLNHYEAYRSYGEAIGHYERLFEIHPELLVHDLHPDYASTRYAIDRERQDSIPRLAVQHHHAHLASCLADNQVQGPAIGVILDGTGFGTDGTIWGGEFLVGDCREFRRAAHFRNVPMPGGERAIREPWRMAAAYLVDAGLDDRPLRHRVPSLALATVNRLIERKLNAPLTSSVGRLFDAIASMIGLRDRVSHEGQAAIELEWLATGAPNSGSYPFEIEEIGGDGAPLTIDVRLMFIQIVSEVDRGVQPAIIARRFHSTLVEIITEVCLRLRRQTGIDLVALSGGVFQNALLSVEVLNRLTEEGLQTLRHRRVPPGDGGLSLGQIAIAAAQDMRQSLAY